MKTTKVINEDDSEQAALMLYFYDQSGFWFKTYVKYNPYFFVRCREEIIPDMIGFLEKKFEKKFASLEVTDKINLDNVDHMSGIKDKYIKLNFVNINDLIKVRMDLRRHFEKNQAADQNGANLNPKNEDFMNQGQGEHRNMNNADFWGEILDMREYDVFYHTRVCIDQEIRCSFWYTLTFKDNYVDTIIRVEDESMVRPEFTIMAYDIECTKQPMKFPDAEIDTVFLISYVINGDGFLITNREVISEDISDFVYAPTAEYETDIFVYNEPDERSLLMRFLEHIKEVKPFIITTFNGDKFDWPFIQRRMEKTNICMFDEIGVYDHEGEFYGRYMVH